MKRVYASRWEALHYKGEMMGSCVAVLGNAERIVRALSCLARRETAFQFAGCYPNVRQLWQLPRVCSDTHLLFVPLAEVRTPSSEAELLALKPNFKLILLARDHVEDAPRVIELLRAGFHGCIVETASAAEVEAGVHLVNEGRVVMPAATANFLIWQIEGTEPTGLPALLSPREREVARGLVMGQRKSEIASELGVSPDTVHAHVKKIFRKLGAHTRAEAVRKYLELSRPVTNRRKTKASTLKIA